MTMLHGKPPTDRARDRAMACEPKAIEGAGEAGHAYDFDATEE